MSFTDKTTSFSQDNLNSFAASLNEKNPVLAATVGSLLEQGKIYAFGTKLIEELSKKTDLTIHAIQEPSSPEILSLNVEDIYFIQTDSATCLLELSGKTRAQIVMVSDLQSDTKLVQNVPDNLFDYKISFIDLQSLYTELNNALYLLKNKYSQCRVNTHCSRPAVFLDRDGVVVEHVDHLCNPQDVKLTSGISEFIKNAHLYGHLVIIVTNQSGLGRQFFSLNEYEQVNQKMLQLLANEQAYIDRIYHSPYFQKSKLLLGLIRKSFRKPRAGMLLTAAHELNIDLKNSIIIGDRATDLMAGVLANLDCAYLLESENSQQEEEIFNDWAQNHPIKINTTFSKIKKFKDIKLKNKQVENALPGN